MQICDFLVADTGHLLNLALSTLYNVRNTNNERIEIDKGFLTCSFWGLQGCSSQMQDIFKPEKQVLILHKCYFYITKESVLIWHTWQVFLAMNMWIRFWKEFCKCTPISKKLPNWFNFKVNFSCRNCLTVKLTHSRRLSCVFVITRNSSHIASRIPHVNQTERKKWLHDVVKKCIGSKINYQFLAVQVNSIQCGDLSLINNMQLHYEAKAFLSFR